MGMYWYVSRAGYARDAVLLLASLISTGNADSGLAGQKYRNSKRRQSLLASLWSSTEGPQAFSARSQIPIRRMQSSFPQLPLRQIPPQISRPRLTHRHIQKPRLPLPNRVLRRFLHRNCNLGLSRPRESLRLPRRRPLRHRPCLRHHGLGLRRHFYLHKPRSRSRNEDRGGYLLRRRSFQLYELQLDRDPGQCAGDFVRDGLLRISDAG